MKEYSFKNKKFDLIICLNGDLPNKEIFNLLSDIPIIAADGAYDKLHSLGIVPIAIVGDMDSITKVHNTTQTHFEYVASQESNDFEKCLYYIKNKGYEDILILGLEGGLLEHTINNTSIVLKYNADFRLTIYHENRYCFLLRESVTLKLEKDEKLSLIPYPKVRLRTKGLKWELDYEYLELGVREGASNVTNSENIILEISEGKCFLFIDSRLPLCPNQIK